MVDMCASADPLVPYGFVVFAMATWRELKKSRTALLIAWSSSTYGTQTRALS
jgi:hypothetical protein